MKADRGQKAVNFINLLTHTKGKWGRTPFKLRPWQERIVRELYGTLGPDGLRQYRTCFIFLPRKNGKTALAAAMALYHLLGEREYGGEIYCAANSRDQATIVYDACKGMVRNDPELLKVCQVLPSVRRIVYDGTVSFLRAIPAEAATAHGFNASVVIYDEIHEARTPELWEVLTTSHAAREQPLDIAITTAGVYDPNSIAYQLYDRAKKIQAGVYSDPTFLPVIYEAEQTDDWQDPEIWAKCNPALGDFRSEKELRQKHLEATQMPSKESWFRRLYLNQWVEAADPWLGIELWRGAEETYREEDLLGEPCYAGLDLASVRDTVALVLAFRCGDGNIRVIPRFWVPADQITKRAHQDRVPYDLWARQGLLLTTPGRSIKQEHIEEEIIRLARRFRILEIAVDPYQAKYLIERLSGAGLQVMEHSQSYIGMAQPCREVERLILDGRLKHPGHEVLNWHASNIVVERDAHGNQRPTKSKSTEKIDGMVALVMAVGRAVLDQGGYRSVYETSPVKIY